MNRSDSIQTSPGGDVQQPGTVSRWWSSSGGVSLTWQFRLRCGVRPPASIHPFGRTARVADY
jgi:hypothetical protein